MQNKSGTLAFDNLANAESDSTLAPFAAWLQNFRQHFEPLRWS